MNHDIIAAGHPPLRYEFATYHNRLPKHWRDEQEGTADFEARLWLAGQIAGLDADLSLLASRATDGSTNSTWPELSEFRCSTCHHDQNIIEDAPASKPLRGLAAYSQWNQLGLWFLDESPSQSTGLNSQDSYQGILTDELLELQKVMESKYRPDPFEVRNAAVSARFALDDLVKSRPLPDFSATQLASALQQKQGQGTITSNWESAAQYYLAAIATRRAWPGGPSGPNGTVADSTRAAIRYPLSRDLNVFPFDAGKERRYKRGEIEILFKSLAESLTSPEYEIE